MSWEIRIPYHDRDELLAEAGFHVSDVIIDPQEQEVTRHLMIDLMLRPGISTVGDALDHLQAVGRTGRRQLLDNARLANGLDTCADTDAHRAFVVANEALLRKPHRPTPRCAVCGAEPLTSAGLPDPNVATVRRWHCRQCEHLAQAGDLDAIPLPIGKHMQLLDPDEIAKTQREDDRLAEADRRRRADRKAEAETIAEARRRYEEAVAEDDYARPLIAGLRGVRMDPR